jgi:hypothetical protein
MVKCDRSGIACNHANYENEDKIKIMCDATKDVCYNTRYCSKERHVIFSGSAEYCKIRRLE